MVTKLTTQLTSKHGSLEPGPTSLFPNFVGGGSTDVTSVTVDGGFQEFTVGSTVAEVQSIVVDGGSAEFVVGEIITDDGIGAGTGTIIAIRGSSGVWDGGTSTGTATLILDAVTGTFTNNAGITGDIAGVAVGDGTGTGVGAGTGVVEQINDSSGVWNSDTASGTAVLVLSGVSGTFTNNAYIKGDGAAGFALNADTGTAGVIPNDPTSVKGKGIVSIEASDVVDEIGKFTITLKDKWAGLLSVKSCVIDTTTPDDWEVLVVSETVATTKLIVIQVLKGGAAAAPTDDEQVFLEIVLATSNMKPVSY